MVTKKTKETQNLVDQLTDDLSEVRVLPSPLKRTVFWGLASLLMIALAALPFKALHYEVTLMYQLKFMIEMLVITAIGFFTLYACFRLSIPDIKHSKTAFVLIGAATVFWALVSLVLYIKSAPLDLHEEVMHLTTHYCVQGLGIITAIPAIALYATLRKTAPTLPSWTGYTALLSVLSFGTIAVRYVCPTETYAHLLVHHFGPALFLSFLGLILGKFLLRW